MKKKVNNPITLKIKYTCTDAEQEIINNILKAYNSILRFTYNRVEKNPKQTTKELYTAQLFCNKDKIIGSHLLNSAQYQARSIYETKSDKPIIFGGRGNFIKLCQHKITKEKWNELRLLPLYSVGESNQKGNRLFQIIDMEVILFKPNKDMHIELHLQSVGKNNIKKLERLIELQNQKAIPLTYQLNKEYVYITYDNSIFEHYEYSLKSNRVMAIDINPNYIGWSVTDWDGDYKFHLINSGMFSLKSLNDFNNSLSVSSSDKLSIYVTNKRNHEIIEIAKQLFKLCRHYHCESFIIEDLSINPINKQNKKGKKYRKLINNNWNRNLLVRQITKHIKSSSTELILVKPEYSSIIGNLVNRNLNLPDPILSSIEIARRGFEFGAQYIFKRRPKQKTVIFPSFEIVKQIIFLSLEELDVIVPKLKKWEDVFQLVKNSKLKYRVPLSNEQLDSPSSKFYKQKYLTVYNF